jgi:hypothetical protein
MTKDPSLVRHGRWVSRGSSIRSGATGSSVMVWIGSMRISDPLPIVRSLLLSRIYCNAYRLGAKWRWSR